MPPCSADRFAEETTGTAATTAAPTPVTAPADDAMEAAGVGGVPSQLVGNGWRLA